MAHHGDVRIGQRLDRGRHLAAPFELDRLAVCLLENPATGKFLRRFRQCRLLRPVGTGAGESSARAAAVAEKRFRPLGRSFRIRVVYRHFTRSEQILLAAARKIHIIGIGDDGLDGVTTGARRLIDEAELLLGTEATLAKVPQSKAQRCALGANLDQAVEKLSTLGGKRAVVLASGDPLFYGVARYLCDKLGKDSFDVVPHVSSMQLAFARVKESWEEAFLTNLANHPLEQVVERIRTAPRSGCSPASSIPPRRLPAPCWTGGSTIFRPMSARISVRRTNA